MTRTASASGRPQWPALGLFIRSTHRPRACASSVPLRGGGAVEKPSVLNLKERALTNCTGRLIFPSLTAKGGPGCVGLKWLARAQYEILPEPDASCFRVRPVSTW